MRKSFAAVAVAGLLSSATTIALTATPAEAATCTKPQIVSSSVSPKSIALGTKDPKGFVLTAKIRPNGCKVGPVEADLFGPVGASDTLKLDYVSTVGGVATYDIGLKLNPGSIGNEDAGRWISYLYVSNFEGVSDYGPSITIRRNARLSTNAKPEPVKKGKTITITGELERANWDTLKYRGYTKHDVSLQWRSKTGSYSTLKTVTTDSDGRVKTTVKATKDGYFRFVFAGSTTTAPVKSKGDYVDVK